MTLTRRPFVLLAVFNCSSISAALERADFAPPEIALPAVLLHLIIKGVETVTEALKKEQELLKLVTKDLPRPKNPFRPVEAPTAPALLIPAQAEREAVDMTDKTLRAIAVKALETGESKVLVRGVSTYGFKSEPTQKTAAAVSPNPINP